MVVKQDGSFTGTVGGGDIETQARNLAIRMIEEQRSTLQWLSSGESNPISMDSTCGGHIQILVEGVNPKSTILQGLKKATEEHQKAWLVTFFPSTEQDTDHLLVQANGEVIGSLPSGLTLEMVTRVRIPVVISCGQTQGLIEPINMDGTVYIFGAGHVARSLAGFTKAVGFRTIVLDNRPELTHRVNFPNVDELILLDSFTDVIGKADIDSDSFIIILTPSHQSDLMVLAQVLSTNAAYIGMLGSRRKCEAIFQELRRMGFQDGNIQRVHAPIGISIDAETPEEIGISIVAQMIQCRAKLRW